MFCSRFNEANERPRHATATVAIRSKPIAPGDGPTFTTVELYDGSRELARIFCVLSVVKGP